MTSSQSNLLWIVLGCSVFALSFAIWLARWVLSRGRGTPEMQPISDANQQCAGDYRARQYKTRALL